MHDASQPSPCFSLFLLAFMAMHVQMHTFTQVPRLECWCADFSRGTEILNQDHHHGPELRNRGVSGTTRERPSRTFPSQDGHTPLMNTDSHETLHWSRRAQGPLTRSIPHVWVLLTPWFSEVCAFKQPFLNRIELHNPGLSTHQGIHSQDIDRIGAWQSNPGASQVIFLQCSDRGLSQVGTGLD